MLQPLWKTELLSPNKLNIELPYDNGPTSGYISKRTERGVLKSYLYAVFTEASTTVVKRKMGATQVSRDR